MLLLLLLAGCPLPKSSDSDEPTEDTCDAEAETFSPTAPDRLDALWVIDNSISMREEQTKVADAAQAFFDALGGADAQVAVLTTDVSADNPQAGALLGSPAVLTDDAEAFADRMAMGTGGSDQESGLEAAWLAITPPLADTVNAGFLRAGARFAVIAVSDENNCSDGGAFGEEATGEDCYTHYEDLVPVEEMVAAYQDVVADVRVSGIIGPEIIGANCEDTVPGRRYAEAIDLTGGARGDICATGYDTAMTAIAAASLGPSVRFVLVGSPDPATLNVEVDGVPVARDDEDGWTWEAPAIVFHGEAGPELGQAITVAYAPAACD